MEQREHRRFLAIAGASAFFTVALLPLYTQLFPINFLQEEYAIWREQLQFVDTPRADDPEVIVMGDSRVQAALIPELVAPDTRSLALGGSTPMTAYYLLRRYLAVHRPPEELLLSFAPYHLERQDCFWERTVKWKALAPREYFEAFERSVALGDPQFGSTSRGRLYGEWALYWLNYPPYYLAELKNARLFLRRDDNLRKSEEVRAAAGHSFFGERDSSSELNDETERSDFAPSPLMDAYLRDFLALAAEQGIRVTYAAMPMNASSFERLSDGFRRGYRAYLEALQADFPRAQIVSEIEFLPDHYFGDRSHLNARGARLVSERYAALLAQDEDARRAESGGSSALATPHEALAAAGR